MFRVRRTWTPEQDKPRFKLQSAVQGSVMMGKLFNFSIPWFVIYQIETATFTIVIANRVS